MILIVYIQIWMLFGVMIHKHPLLLNTLSTLIIFLFLSHHKSYNTYVIFSLFLLSLGVHGIMGVHQIYFPIINSLLLWCLQVGIISSLSLCPWNTGSFLLDSPSSFRTCKGPFLFVQVEVWRRMLSWIFFYLQFLPYFYVIFLTVILFDRAKQDDDWCKSK